MGAIASQDVMAACVAISRDVLAGHYRALMTGRLFEQGSRLGGSLTACQHTLSHREIRAIWSIACSVR